MAVRVVLTPTAESHIRAIDQWWREMRPAAPLLFAEELTSMLEVLAAMPQAAREYPHPTVPGVRRALLRASRYHVYFAVTGELVIVLAVWSAVRGAGPTLGGGIAD